MQEENLGRRVDAIERNVSDVSRMVTALTDELSSIKGRLKSLEEAQQDNRVKGAAETERDKALQADIENIKEDIKSIKSLGKWALMIFIGAIITAFVTFIVRGAIAVSRNLAFLALYVCAAMVLMMGVFTIGSLIETKFWPAYGKFRLVSVEPYGDGYSKAVFAFEKKRSCTPAGFAWFNGEIGNSYQVVDFRVDGASGSGVTRPPGHHISSPYIIEVNPNEVRTSHLARSTAGVTRSGSRGRRFTPEKVVISCPCTIDGGPQAF